MFVYVHIRLNTIVWYCIVQTNILKTYKQTNIRTIMLVLNKKNNITYL